MFTKKPLFHEVMTKKFALCGSPSLFPKNSVEPSTLLSLSAELNTGRVYGIPNYAVICHHKIVSSWNYMICRAIIGGLENPMTWLLRYCTFYACMQRKEIKILVSFSVYESSWWAWHEWGSSPPSMLSYVGRWYGEHDCRLNEMRRIHDSYYWYWVKFNWIKLLCPPWHRWLLCQVLGARNRNGFQKWMSAFCFTGICIRWMFNAIEFLCYAVLHNCYSVFILYCNRCLNWWPSFVYFSSSYALLRTYFWMWLYCITVFLQRLCTVKVAAGSWSVNAQHTLR
jgi:hypothetical protein